MSGTYIHTCAHCSSITATVIPAPTECFLSDVVYAVTPNSRSFCSRGLVYYPANKRETTPPPPSQKKARLEITVQCHAVRYVRYCSCIEIFVLTTPLHSTPLNTHTAHTHSPCPVLSCLDIMFTSHPESTASGALRRTGECTDRPFLSPTPIYLSISDMGIIIS